MFAIYKYPLGIGDKQQLMLPKHAQLLCVNMQHDTIVVYALVNTEAERTDEYEFYIFGTGRPIAVRYDEYLGTVTDRLGLVGHICYKRIEP